MSGTEAKGLSLWLMPDEAAAGPLRRWIERLAARHGGERFAPHLTLVSGIASSESAAQAAASDAAAAIAPFRLQLGSLDGRHEHFRCVFVRASSAPDLRAAHAAASRALGRPPQADFLPHVSLFYGTLRATQKAAIRREAAFGLRLAFEARALHLWSTNGPVPSWRELAVFSLRG